MYLDSRGFLAYEPGGQVGGPIHHALYELGGVFQIEHLLFKIYFIIVTSLIIARRCGGWQYEVVVHGNVLGTNRNNCRRKQERAWARIASRVSHTRWANRSNLWKQTTRYGKNSSTDLKCVREQWARIARHTLEALHWHNNYNIL